MQTTAQDGGFLIYMPLRIHYRTVYRSWQPVKNLSPFGELRPLSRD